MGISGRIGSGFPGATALRSAVPGLPEFCSVLYYTLVEGQLRIGGNLGAFYTSRRLDGLVGPRLAYNLYDKSQLLKSSIYNVQLFTEHLWGFRQQRLLGGGVALEVGQLAIVSLRAHWEYVGVASSTQQAWWFQTTLGINLFKKKKSDDPFNP